MTDPHGAAASARISVLMAVRDGERYLDEAMTSVLGQSLEDIEVIVVDDGSRDRTPDLLERWRTKDARVRVVRQAQAGLAAALNRAAALARGEYLARQDADDVSLPDRLARQVARLDREPDLAGIGSAAEVIDNEGRVIGVLPAPSGRQAVRRGLVTARVTPVHGSMLIRRSAFAAVGGYREAFPVSQDFDLWLRLLERLELDNVPEPLYRWRRHAAGVSAIRRAHQLRYAGVMLAFAHERSRHGVDSYALLEGVGGDVDAFAARYRLRGRLHAVWGELLYRGLGRPEIARGFLWRAVRQGWVWPRTLGLLVGSCLGVSWPTVRWD